MKINLDNYEQHLVDFIEGNLSKEIQHEVEAFLLAYPDIQLELDAFVTFEKIAEDHVFDAKSELKKIPIKQTGVDSDYFNKLCIGSFEEINSPSEEILLTQLIAGDSEKALLFKQYKSTKLTQQHIVFEEKLLNKKEPIRHVINEGNFSEYCIACSEGWLDYTGILTLNAYVSEDESRQTLYQQIQNLKLVPDTSVQFEGKSKLKRFRIISEKNKKRLVYISGVAAMALFSLLFYNSNQLDELKIVEASVYSITEKPVVESLEIIMNDKLEEKKVKQKLPIYKDPLRISGHSFEPTIQDESQVVELNLETINPIKIQKIECPKCLAYNETSNFLKREPNYISMEASSQQPIENQQDIPEDELGWKIAQASISGINKVTNAELALKKKSTDEKTRIAFSSKFFSISAPVKNK